MGHRYYLYGSSGMGLREVCDALSLSLGVSFESRESDFKGGGRVVGAGKFGLSSMSEGGMLRTD